MWMLAVAIFVKAHENFALSFIQILPIVFLFFSNTFLLFLTVLYASCWLCNLVHIKGFSWNIFLFF